MTTSCGSSTSLASPKTHGSKHGCPMDRAKSPTLPDSQISLHSLASASGLRRYSSFLPSVRTTTHCRSTSVSNIFCIYLQCSKADFDQTDNLYPKRRPQPHHDPSLLAIEDRYSRLFTTLYRLTTCLAFASNESNTRRIYIQTLSVIFIFIFHSVTFSEPSTRCLHI